MKSLIRTGVRIFLVISTGLPFTAASAQQPGVTPILQDKLPLWHGSLTRARNGSPAQLATEAAAAAVEWKKTQADIAHGESLMKAGDLDAAIDVFQQLTADDPQDALAYQRLAEAQTAAGELTDAAASYRTVLYKWPGKNWGNVQNGDPVVHMQFALLLLRLNQRAEALSVYQHGYQLLQMEEDPANSLAARPLPKMLTAPDFTATQLESAADTVIAVHNYAWVNQSASLADFQHVLRLQPDSALSYFYLGQIYKFQPGREADAVNAFHKAAQLGGSEMQPFLEKARKGGLAEFKVAAKQAEVAAP